MNPAGGMGERELSAIQEVPDGVALSVHVQPRASQTECVGFHGERLKFRVAAPPTGGLANAVLCRFLAEALKVPKQAVVVAAGQGSRQKRLMIKGVSQRQVIEALFP